jgi:carbamoyltransferase
MKTAILGLSAFYHDSAAAIVVDGKIVAAAQEERFTRKKHDSGFPINACRFVLSEAGLSYDDLAAVSFYDKPLLKFERLLETYHAFAPKGLGSFTAAIPVWIKEKLFMRRMLDDSLRELGGTAVPVYFPEHHLSHAASAYYPSPFSDAAILTVDGVGEWATTTISHGRGKDIEILRELQFPHSVGLLYSAFTYYTGFTVNSGEYKLMGLAPYGNRRSTQTQDFKKKIASELVDIREDGSVVLNMEYFDYATGLKMTNDDRWQKLFGVERRPAESSLLQVHMDLALAIQEITEDIVLRLAKSARELTGSKNLVLAGGVALNCVANGKILKAMCFDDLWIQPAAGDAGGALGAALAVWHIQRREQRQPCGCRDAMTGSYLGPEFSDKDVRRALGKHSAPMCHYERFGDLAADVAAWLAEGNVVGWFQGRMEFGPRALGNRSILGDARNPEMQKKMNLKIKYREGFRPFAPSVLEEDIAIYFDLDRPSPYMLLVTPIHEDRQIPWPDGYDEKSLSERLYFVRSDLPAITHIDYSARIQSVSRETNSRYWELINQFKKLTGYGVILNTSFNVRGEPIVCTPEDAYRCFMRTEMDILVVGNFVLKKSEQPKLAGDSEWQREFKLD